MVRNVNFNGHI